VICFHKIRWKNFLSTGNVFTEMELNKNHSTLIIGDNGAGKSTILDALTFVLFGKPFRSVNKNLLVNSINQGGTEVEVEFSIGNKEYLVRRGIKKNFFEIHQDGKLLNQDASVRDYQEFLEKTILKLNYKSFTQIVLLGSSSFIPFMQLKASDRRAIIEDLLDIEVFSVMNSLLRQKISSNKENLSQVTMSLESAQNEERVYKKMIEELKSDKTQQIENNLKDIQTHEQSKSSQMEQINALLKENEDLLNTVTDEQKVSKSLNTLKDYQKGIEKNLLKFHKEMEFYEQNEECGTCRQTIDASFRTKMITEFHDKMHQNKNALLELGAELQKKNERIIEIEKIQSQIRENNTKMVKLKSSVDAIDKYIQKVLEQNQVISERTDDIESKKLELEEISNKIRIYSDRKEELVNEKYLFDTASVLLKDSGIKTKIIKQYLPVINKLINIHLNKMDFFVSFELDENFNETIKSRHRDEFTYSSFSEGEKMRIDLALLFTWRAVAKLKNSVNTNLLIMDEVFDSSLDNSGTDEFLKIIYDLTEDVNVFIISHKGEVLYDKFDKVVKFEKHKNFSQMVEP